MTETGTFNHEAVSILESLSDGIYVTDRDRRIVYWNQAAERITGWAADDILGHTCYDNILCHIDKDGHQLCGEEFCPLHRAIVTGSRSELPIIVFAKRPDGQRVPCHVTVSPLRNRAGEIIGGVECFRDLSDPFRDLKRAQRIQSLAMRSDIGTDPRVDFQFHYVPFDIIGGDFYTAERLGEDEYAFMLADVMGHGIASALYTMHLRSLWDQCREAMREPGRFARLMNDQLRSLIDEEVSFASASFGFFDAATGRLALASSGNPPPLFVNAGGGTDVVRQSGTPLGILENNEVGEVERTLNPGDSLLLLTDGAIEATDASDNQLGLDGLADVLERLRFHEGGVTLERVEEEILRFSNQIRLNDDLTLLSLRYLG